MMPPPTHMQDLYTHSMHTTHTHLTHAQYITNNTVHATCNIHTTYATYTHHTHTHTHTNNSNNKTNLGMPTHWLLGAYHL